MKARRWGVMALALAFAATAEEKTPAPIIPMRPAGVWQPPAGYSKLRPDVSPALLDRSCLVKKPITPRDLEVAKTAWKYFEKNYQPKTGLVNSADGYPSTTLWDAASVIAGTMGARELDIISQKEFDDRISQLLGTLATQKLFGDEAPNKAYNTETGEMSDYANHPSPGIGYSAIDLARMISWLNLLSCFHPKHRDVAERILQRWKYCRIIRDGQMHGIYIDEKTRQEIVAQEGRLGYEQYAAKAFGLLDFDTHQSGSYRHHATTTRIFDIPIQHDDRDFKKLGAHDYVVTESYALDAIEFGNDPLGQVLLERVYEVQKRRWECTGTVTAVSEDNVDRPPWFVYNSIYVDGSPWRTITDTGEEHPELRSISTKAAFALAALFPEEGYSQVLLDKIASAYDPERGWYSGIYETGRYNKAITANTNGILLEIMLYKMYGSLNTVCKHCDRRLRFSPMSVSASPKDHCLPKVEGRDKLLR